MAFRKSIDPPLTFPAGKAGVSRLISKFLNHSLSFSFGLALGVAACARAGVRLSRPRGRTYGHVKKYVGLGGRGGRRGAGAQGAGLSLCRPCPPAPVRSWKEPVAMVKPRLGRGSGQHLLPTPRPMLSLSPGQPRWRPRWALCPQPACSSSCLEPWPTHVCLGPRAPGQLQSGQAAVWGDFGCPLRV